MEEYSPDDNFIIQFKNNSDTQKFADVQLLYKGEENGVKKYSCHFMNITGNVKSLLKITVENTKINEAEILFYGGKYTHFEE